MKLIIEIPKKVVTSIQNGEDYRYDIHTAIAQGIPYEERPHGECENCHFRKFAETVVDGFVDVMNKNGIEDFDELAKQCGVSYLHQDSITKSDTQM